jgi:hypothetical protein
MSSTRPATNRRSVCSLSAYSFARLKLPPSEQEFKILAKTVYQAIQFSNIVYERFSFGLIGCLRKLKLPTISEAFPFFDLSACPELMLAIEISALDVVRDGVISPTGIEKWPIDLIETYSLAFSPDPFPALFPTSFRAAHVATPAALRSSTALARILPMSSLRRFTSKGGV